MMRFVEETVSIVRPVKNKVKIKSNQINLVSKRSTDNFLFDTGLRTLKERKSLQFYHADELKLDMGKHPFILVIEI